MSGEANRWFHTAPNSWRIQPLKALFRVMGGSTPKSDTADFWDGDVVWVTPSDLHDGAIASLDGSKRTITELGLSSCGTTLVPAGSIVLSTRAPIGSLGIAKVPLCTNQGCKSLVPCFPLSTWFYAYVLSVATSELRVRGRGTTFLELSSEALSAFRVPVPPLNEQTAIAAFLDRETGKIDALVEEQRRLIELLKEKRQAVISHAVTKGLDPNVRLKPSGVEWLGDVPEHWEVRSLRYSLSSITSGTSVNAIDTPAGEGEFGVLKTSSVYAGRFDPTENKAVLPEERERVSCPVLRGSIIVSRMNTPELVGASGLVMDEVDGIYLPDRLWQVSIREGSAAFFHLWMQSLGYRDQVKVASAGASSSMQNLAQDQFRALMLAVPPEEEQERIAGYLSSALVNLDSLVDEAKAAIALLQERRSALISAAVTGKVDVRTVAAQEEAA